VSSTINFPSLSLIRDLVADLPSTISATRSSLSTALRLFGDRLEMFATSPFDVPMKSGFSEEVLSGATPNLARLYL
jgi:hypothetical protein